MTWWRENFDKRFGYKLPTGLDAAGQPIYGALQMADCAHEKTSQLESGVDNESERITDVFQTEAPLVRTAKVWRPCADTSDDSVALHVRKIDEATDMEDSSAVLREALCG